MFFLTLIGLFLRLSYINKPEGLWNDEYVSWMISAVPFGNGFWEAVHNQCHMPLYYLYLKPFAHCSDLVLRLTSVVPAVLAILVMYLVGKEYSRKTGIFAATITSVLSFLVYYSQEVRLYSLLFLLSSILLLFTLRIIKNKSAYNIAGLIITSALVIFTHILGIIFVFFNSIYIVFKMKKLSLKILLPTILLCFLALPFIVHIMTMSPSSQWWGKFGYTNILFLFSDYLSPILTNHINAPPVFFYNLRLVFWLTVPTLIGITGIIFGIKNNKGITAVTLCTALTLILLAIFGKILLITKYSIEILPTLILLMSVGFERLKKTGLILFALFISFHIASIFTPYYVTKIPHPEGHKLVCDILNNQKPDKIIFTYYAPDRFSRYLNYKPDSQTSIDKNNRFEYTGDSAKIFNHIKKDETISVVFLNSISFLPQEYFYNQKIPEMYRTFSIIKYRLIKTLDKDFTDFKIDNSGEWTVITAKKQ